MTGRVGQRGALRRSTVAIIGLGLMGGSLGLALGGFCAERIGWDIDDTAGNAALDRGAVDRLAPSLEAAAASADVVVLAAPVCSIVEMVPAVVAVMRPGALLTDIGSTKGRVVEAMREHVRAVLAIGGHPMCGRESGGIDRADGALFLGATWALVPTTAGEGSDAGWRADEALERSAELVRAVGAKPLLITAASHDMAVAASSHIAYVSAGMLVGVLESVAQAQPVARDLVAGGFRDAARLAGGDPEVWRDILVTNRDAVTAVLDTLSGELEAVRALVAAGEVEEVAAWTQRAYDRQRAASRGTAAPGVR